MTTRRRASVAALLAALVPLASGCAGATASMAPSATLTTAMEGWERWLHVEWTAQAGPGGHAIDGYVYSNYGSPMYDVRLLAQGLDGAGNVVSQRIVWVPGLVPALQRSYFRVPVMPSAASYRVTVWAFEMVQSHSYL